MSYIRPTPVYSHQAATGTGPGLVIDTGSGDESGAPFVLFVNMSAESTVAIEGSHDGVNFLRWEPSTGYTSNVAKELRFGVRYWRTNIIANGGSVTSYVGQTSKLSGGWHSANNITEQS